MEKQDISRYSSIWYDMACGLMAVITGLVAGWADFNNDEAQSAVILLLLFGILLGMASQRITWLWPVLLGIGVPMAYIIGRALGFKPHSWPEPGVYASLLALIPAFLGTWVGGLIRKLSHI